MYRVQFGAIREAIRSAPFAAGGDEAVMLPSGMRVLIPTGA